MDKTKPFGLIISKRSQSFRPSTSTVFQSDSDDEPTTQKKMPKIPQAKPIKAAPTEDPSIYEYDSVYDDMKAQEVAKAAPKDANKPSRYIGSLLKAADKRKKDQERRVEKKVHHEREKEGDKFKDKEAFVTSSYKKKMQEMEEEEERERRENMLNEMMDVTKQKDLSGFYRHFLKQSVGEEKIPVFGERYSVKQEEGTTIKEEKLSDTEKDKTLAGENVDQDTDLGSSSDGETGDGANRNELKDRRTKGHRSEKRPVLPENIDRDSDIDSSSDGESPKHVDKASKKSFTKDRQTKGSKSEKVTESANRDSDNSKSDDNGQRNLSSGNGKMTKKSHQAKKPSLEDDVDQDSDSSSSDEERPKKDRDHSKRSSKKNTDEDLPKKRKMSPEKSQRNIRKRTEDDDSLSEEPQSETDGGKSGSKESGRVEKGSNSEEKNIQPKKTREEIFAKRTVGEVFAEAQARYFQRMAARSG